MAKSTSDSLLTDLTCYLGQRIEVVAFGISYIGLLAEVNAQDGLIKLSDGCDCAILELERIETYVPLSPQ